MADTQITAIIDKLTQGDSEAWSNFLFNIDLAKRLKQLDALLAPAVLQAGVAWTGGGWTTGSASRKLWEVVKIPLVISDFKEYLHIWLFTMAMAWGLDVPTLTLSPPAAEAAFHLLELLQDGDGPSPARMEMDPNPPAPTAELPESLPWEEQMENMPPELHYLLQKAANGERLDLSEILKDVPRWAGLPTKAPENNHRPTRQDRDLRTVQQSLLHGLRLLIWAYFSEEDATPWQITFKHFCDTFYRVEGLRKELGMPGSTNTGKEVLYTKEDLSQAAFNAKVRAYRTYRSVSGGASGLPPQCSFRPYVSLPFSIRTSAKGAKGVGAKGKASYFPTSGFRPSYGSYGKGRKGGRGRGRGMAPLQTSSPQRPSSPQGRRTRSEEPRGRAMAAKTASGSRSSPPQLRPSLPTQTEQVLVGQAWQQDRHKTGDRRPSGRPPHPLRPVQDGTAQDIHRDRISAGATGRVHGDRGSGGHEGSAPPLTSLVRHHQDRTTPRSFFARGGSAKHQKETHSGCTRNKQFFPPPSFQDGPLGDHFSLSPPPLVGRETGPQACLFPSPCESRTSTILVSSSGRKGFPIQRSSLWHLHHPLLVDKNDANPGQVVEIKRNSLLSVPGRHSRFRSQPISGCQTSPVHGGNFGGGRFDSQLQKVRSHSMPTFDTSGVPSGPKDRIFESATRKTSISQKRSGQSVGQTNHDPQKNVTNFGKCPIFPHSNALFEGIHRQNALVHSEKPLGVGSASPHSPPFAGRSERIKNPPLLLGRTPLLPPFSGKDHPLRQLKLGVGGGGRSRSSGPRFLEKTSQLAHQPQRVGSQCQSSQIIGQGRRGHQTCRGQYRLPVISHQNWRSSCLSQRSHQGSVQVVSSKEHHFASGKSSQCTVLGRFAESLVRPQRLCPKPTPFSLSARTFPSLDPTRSRPVCLPQQLSNSKVHFPISTLGQFPGGRPSLLSGRHYPRLLQPPLAPDRPVAPEVERQSPSAVPADNTPVGFIILDAPSQKNAGPQSSPAGYKILSRNVPELQRTIDARASLGPPLHTVIRQSLQKQQVCSETISHFLLSSPGLNRYDSAWRKFWGFLQEKGCCLDEMSLTQVAASLVEVSHIYPSQGRYMYSALLQVPHLAPLRFQPLLSKLKRVWNSSSPKYISFWDAKPVLHSFQKKVQFDFSMSALRNKCILSWRLFMLYRSVDLSRLYRKISFIDNQPYVWVQRKGWSQPRWEAVPILPSLGQLCPWTSLLTYVQATADHCLAGSEVFRSLTPPFHKLCSNSLGRITREILRDQGINVSLWQPHNTRGAGVSMFKELGLSSEQVCEIGAWKSSATFGQYYLRLNAAKNLNRFVEKLQVHTVSPGDCAELDQTRTPRTNRDLGGSVWESQAQDTGEPNPPQNKFSTYRGKKRPLIQPRFSTPPLRFKFAKVLPAEQSVPPSTASNSTLTESAGQKT